MEPTVRAGDLRDDDRILSRTSSRLPSAADTLAPLEFLQTQRRGSITDPQLHAAPSTQLPPRRPSPSRPPHTPRLLERVVSPDTAKPYLFPPSSPPPFDSEAQEKTVGHHMTQDSQDQDQRFSHNYSPTQGTKRKMSSDQPGFSPFGNEIDPQLVNTVNMAVDPDAPPPKRRGSAVAAQNMSQLSLYDRRSSMDARIAISAGYPPAGFSADSPHGREPAFAWPATQAPGQSPHPTQPLQPEGDSNTSDSPRPFDSASPMSSIPGMPYVPSQAHMQAPGTEPVSGPTRALRSRSRPESRAGEPLHTVDQMDIAAQQDVNQLLADNPDSEQEGQGSSSGRTSKGTPYSRSPELRVSHKLAERKRRKEMKDLFDELRDHLPADRGMKASKWEILSKAIDFVGQMKNDHQAMMQEIEHLRRENESLRQGHGIPAFTPGMVYPSSMAVGYPPPGPVPSGMPGQPLQTSDPGSSNGTPQAPLSRPGSAQLPYAPGAPVNGAGDGGLA